MRSSRKSLCAVAFALLLALQPLLAQFKPALPGYRYEFPRDYFNHADYQTEWWYYTGNLQSTDGRKFGFELAAICALQISCVVPPLSLVVRMVEIIAREFVTVPRKRRFELSE